ncbi:hypothetical protein pEaSNUABM8_00137 [Erwinia phage pEa_SNUABM_8]|nr:hypothetical protein pEaSNUABM8_00137 [Erwinia phage pEa_SNUABM_8]QVW54889.1 hypothetical protein pEaSNUABM4_00136 [Erwinia phage pEa_SNUABM_4]
MAKIKKPRNKKYSPKMALAETSRMVAENALNRIAFIGASNRRLQPFGGRGFQYTVGTRVRVTVSAALAETLFEDERHWNLWMCHYANSPNGVQAMSSLLSLDDYTLGDFNEHIQTLVDHTRPEEIADEDYIGFAFFCAPNDRWDFEGPADERLIENFMASGVLEKDTHVPMSVWPVEREELIIKLMADHAKFDVSMKVHARGEGDDYKLVD